MEKRLAFNRLAYPVDIRWRINQPQKDPALCSTGNIIKGSTPPRIFYPSSFFYRPTPKPSKPTLQP